MPSAFRQKEAENDLIGHYDYLEEHANANTAERFLTNAEASFDALAAQPMMGQALTLPYPSHPSLTGLRRWAVNGFPNHLIFYRPEADGVTIVRVLHGASDWWGLLGLEP